MSDLFLQVAKGEFENEGALAEIDQAQSDSIALVHKNISWSYEELFSRVDKLAAHLQAIGVAPNDIIGVYTDRSTEMMVSILGILKAGAAFLPLDPQYPEERIRFMVEDTGTSLILSQEQYRGTLKNFDANIFFVDSDWNDIETTKDDYQLPEVRTDDLAYIIYTSGSTGTPKGVMITFGNLLSYTVMAVDEYKLTAEDNTLQFGTMNFDVFTEEVFPTFLAGGTLVLRNEASALGGNSFWSFIEKHQISFITLPTAFWHTLCTQLDYEQAKMASSVKLLVFGGEAMSEHMLELWQKYFGSEVRLINTYGPSETTVVVTGFDCQDFDGTKGKVPIGKPFNNVECYILDEELQPCAPGKRGELYIAGPQVAKGYLNRQELTSERFIKNPFNAGRFWIMYKTGDICTYLPDGNIAFEGRNDSQVKLRGLRIELGEIETAINRLDSVKESVVILREDSPGDKKIVAYLVASGESFDPKLIRQELKNVLAGYMIPSAFVPLEKIPLTTNGKVNRRILPPPERKHLASGTDVKLPENTLEETLLGIWENVVNVSPISVEDNFFDIGGHSLIAVQLFDDIRNRIGVDLPLAALFEAPTIRELADYIKGEEDELLTVSASPMVRINEKGTQVPFYCIHGHFGNVLNFAALSRELGKDQPFYGLQGIGFGGVEIPLTRIEEIAERYVREIKAIQSEGPYSLGGYCYGTLVALEVAKQLKRNEDEIAHLVMFDPQPNLYPELLERDVLHDFEDLKKRQRAEIIKNEITGKSILKKAEYFTFRLRDRLISDLYVNGIKFFKKVGRPTGMKLPKILRDVEYTNFVAMNEYNVKGPWEGDIDMIMSKPVVDGYSDQPEDDWSAMATGQVHVHFIEDNGVIAGGEMFKKPYVYKTAEKLKSVLQTKNKDLNYVTSKNGEVKYG
ncbi:MAG: amino acid adenylation domain-containing protein [Gracilimonas sp.]|nr:amino acid adenylation domain-containing protein [Gracilimonas sp.]